MVSPPVVGAVSALQNQALASNDIYELDRIDRALDELLRNPTDASTSARRRIRSAVGHAYEALGRRRTVAPQISLDEEHFNCACSDHRYAIVEILHWLNTEPRLAHGERTILRDLANGLKLDSIAHHGVPLPRMRERISRSRSRARELWRQMEELT